MHLETFENEYPLGMLFNREHLLLVDQHEVDSN